MDLVRLIQGLAQPSAYPFAVDAIEVHQTHISAVFLAGPYAYKIKKPVNPGFLDFSTLEKRLHFCNEEVRLNRRLAPHVYLGVVPIVEHGGVVRIECAGSAIEWAVKMQRLPGSATFEERLGRDELGVEPAESLARRLAAFHGTAETSARIAAFGRFEGVSRIILDIFNQAAAQVGNTVSPAVFGRVKTLTETALGRLRSLIDRRASAGVPRDCHGDLHLDHVYYFPEQKPPADLVIVDCIEFNERFRYIDPVADMAFAAMDFAYHGQRDLARAFAKAYFCASGDEDGRALLPLYLAYRATVRGAMEGLLLTETEVPEAERARALARARARWLLALGELEVPCRRPCMILVSGLPGTGKSRLARDLAEDAHFVVIRSDVVRKQLAGRSPSEAPPERLPESFYSPRWHARTYRECLHRAERLIFEGERVLIDANFREEAQRRTFLEAATRWGVPAGIFVCQAAPETVRKRLEQREGDASDADWAVYLSVAKRWQEFGTKTQRWMQVISTDGDASESRSRPLEALRRWGLGE